MGAVHGETTGLYDQSKASARFEHYPPVKLRLDDDYQYCVVDAVFSPSMPDPGGYSVKFAGAPHEQWLGKPGRTPFGRPEHAGYGNYRMTIQTCRSLLDPPNKRCPEWPN
jgi:hypothetical protein